MARSCELCESNRHQRNEKSGMPNMLMDMISSLSENVTAYLSGLSINLIIALTSSIVGIAWGFLLALGQSSRFQGFRIICNFYVFLFRSLMPLILIYIGYFGLAFFGGAPREISALSVVLVVFGLTAPAFFAETIRSAILAAAPDWRTSNIKLADIFKPALCTALPGLTNQVLMLFYASAAASIFGVDDVLRVANIVSVKDYEFGAAYGTALLLAMAPALILQLASRLVERRLRASLAVGSKDASVQFV